MRLAVPVFRTVSGLRPTTLPKDITYIQPYPRTFSSQQQGAGGTDKTDGFLTPYRKKLLGVILALHIPFIYFRYFRKTAETK